MRKAAALDLATERYPLFGGDRLEVDSAKTEEREIGWLFHAQSKRFLETGDASAELLDVQPIFVHRQTAEPTWVKRYGPSDFVVDGKPGPDWPPLGFIAVPAAVVVQGVAWVSVWWGLFFLGRLIGFVPLQLIALLLGALLAVTPAGRVVAWAGFRNFNRWVGLAVVVLGILLAEFASAHFGLMPSLSFELGRLGVSFEVPMEVFELVAAVVMGTGGTFIGQENKSRRMVWEASRVISAPADSDEEDDD